MKFQTVNWNAIKIETVQDAADRLQWKLILCYTVNIKTNIKTLMTAATV
jgi:hypothetical protein